MERAEQTTLGERLPIEDLQSLFENQQVSVAICFGSHVRGQEHNDSDIDIAIEFADTRPGEDSYNDTFFRMYEAVSEVIATDDVDLVDVHSLSGSLARAVFSEGVLLYGDRDRVETLRDQYIEGDGARRSPRERLDDAIEQIDEHLA